MKEKIGTLLACLTGLLYAANSISLGSIRGVPTFECIGMYCDYTGDDNRNSVATIQFREKGSGVWRAGHEAWADRTRRQFRVSLVDLKPGTAYDIELSCSDPDGGTGKKTLAVTTWNEKFPIGKTVQVSDMTSLSITESGTANGYILYEAASKGVVVRDVTIDANYVILRGLIIKDAAVNAVAIKSGRHDIVIENCEITNWGHSGPGSTTEEDIFNWDSGIRVHTENCSRIIIQHNEIHDPRGYSNNWLNGYGNSHPKGPHAITFFFSAGNHVIRYNKMHSAKTGNYCNDVVGGGPNGGTGNVRCDTDIYGNLVSHCWDDGLEIEGYNENVRVWGNVIHNCFISIATACLGINSGTENFFGPMYIWRNIQYEGWLAPGDPRSSATKLTGMGGPLYYYHNTVSVPEKGKIKTGIDVKYNNNNGQKYFIGKNNIFDCSSPVDGDLALYAENDLDYNLYSKKPGSLRPEWESHMIVATPTLLKEGEHSYYLQANSYGADKGCPIPNFNDKHFGIAPDMGACEPGTIYMMRIGPHADTLTLPLSLSSIRPGREFSEVEEDIAVYPNPFNPSVLISASARPVYPDFSVRIYGTDGTLVEDLKAIKGSGRVQWAPSEKGSAVYIVRMVNGGKTVSRKMFMLK